MATVAVTELYVTNISRDGAGLTAVRSYIVDTTPADALKSDVTGPLGGVLPDLPQLGDPHPDDPTLLVDSRNVRQRANTDKTIVDVLYKRVTFGDIDPFRVKIGTNAPFIVTEPLSQATFINVPRIIKRSIGTSSGDVNEYVVVNTQQPVPTTLLRTTVHLENFSFTDRDIINQNTGFIDNSANVASQHERAMFMGADVRFLGKNKWRIIYTWKVVPFFLPQISLLIDSTTNSLAEPGQDQEILPVTNANIEANAPAEPDPLLQGRSIRSHK